MKKATSYLALAAMMMAVANGYEPKQRTVNREKMEAPDSPQKKKKRHQLYGGDQTMHNYIINGITIQAVSKKVAKKIYKRMKGGEK